MCVQVTTDIHMMSGGIHLVLTCILLLLGYRDGVGVRGQGELSDVIVTVCGTVLQCGHELN